MGSDRDSRSSGRHERRRGHSSRSPSRERSQRSRHHDRSDSRKRSRSRRHRSRSRNGGDSRHRCSRKKSSEDERDDVPVETVGGYKSTDNPFNDSALGKKFVWKKKVEQDKAKWMDPAERAEAEQRRKEEADRELDGLRKRRELREIEREQRDQEMARQRREQEQEKLGDWERREEEFHLQQAKRRAEIRIKCHRPKTVDILAMNLRLANENLTDEEMAEIGLLRMDVDEPHRLVESLSAADAEELLHDVEMYLSLEANARNVEFWENMLVVATAQLDSVKSGGSGERGVKGEVQEVLRNKSLGELLQVEADVQEKLQGQQGAVDVDYWEQVRGELVVEKAKVTLAEMHAGLLERRLERLRQSQTGSRSGDGRGAGNGGRSGSSEVEQRKRQRLEELQRRILEGQPAEGAAADAAQQSAGQDMPSALFEQELRKDHDPSEAVFSVEAATPARTYAWQDKHRPRKPRYFNRVHTGYEWNRYNQTHYDKDNPPPKVVQGYKFNIFYPDLIDRSQAPTYHVEKDPTSDDTVVLRFSAGPPYEDIAFRIVSREWEYNRRRGFRNTFDRGVLQLYFRFKRHFYRR
ncbi:hypothetical protein LPJ61_000402 [Coemansia biformis]|uniref:Splicing factor Cactin n=1 Tax=Coemansia biformis TaxID=1286918 RepID=A0A9W8D1P0_9FUNG|nr:hypothetical protein LPJ61_000402 [Coemansia biformis]